MKSLGYLTILILASILACSEKDQEPFIAAHIIYAGSPALDGCGWLLQIKDKRYSPLELPEEFQIDGSEALVRFKPLDEYFCGWWGGERFQRIEIFDIKKK